MKQMSDRTATAASALMIMAMTASLLCSPGLATAQPAPAPANPASAAAAPPAGPIDEVEIRIAELHGQLHIASAQETQFRAYADVLRSNAQAMQALFEERAKQTDATAPARLQWYARLTAAHAEAIGKLVAPFDALYQSLSEAQQHDADAYFNQLSQRRMPHRAG